MLLIVRPMLLLAMLLAAAQASAGWQDTPDALRLAPVGDSLRMNGTPMQIRAFRSELPVEKLVGSVEQSWKQSGRGNVMRTSSAGWLILNQSVGDEHRSFQVRDVGPGISEGYVALTSPKMTRPPIPAVRMPSDMAPFSIIESVDGGRATQQMMATSRRSLDATASAVEAQLRASGWTRHVYKRKGGGVILSANKGERQFDSTMTAQTDGTLIMINVSTN